MGLFEVYIGDGSKSVTSPGTRVALSSVSCPAKKVIIQANVTNAGLLAVGGSTVVAAYATRTGIALYASEAFLMEISDLNTVFLDSTAIGDGVTFIYIA